MDSTLKNSNYPSLSLSLFVVTIFLSAFLLFQVQPLIAKHILPWFGGSPSVWTVCMLFFQMLLIGGYAYAHLLDAHLTPHKQAITHIIILCATLLWLPIIPDTAWKPQNSETPVLHILLLLMTSVGLPYFALSTTGTLFQAWFRRLHKGHSPYPLYAVSNAGSLLALLSYPIIVEVWWSTDEQGWFWSVGFTLFVLLSCVVAYRLTTAAGTLSAEASTITSSLAEKVDGEIRFLWLSLPAIASILMLAITNHLTQNVAVVPFLWIVPLSLYLLSFILCFESERWYRRTVWWSAFFLALIAVSYSMYPGVAMSLSLLTTLTLYNTFFFIACMVCHGELVRLRPHGKALTAFYLYIAFGGALGGLFVAVIAPLLFSSYLELHVSLALVYLLAPLAVFRDKSSRYYAGKPRWLWGLWFIGGVLLGVLLYINKAYTHTTYTESSRNFYGVLHIADDNTGNIRKIFHGNILHGTQYLDAKRRHQPTTYYSADSGVGQVMALTAADKQRRIGIIGLGAGTLASYGQAGDILRFYEINPEVVRLATERFFYLSDTPALVETVVGDARLMLEAEVDQDFDVFVIDAFSGDAIPVHLLTHEAFTIYNRHLKDDGVICVHISNRYLDLRPVIEAMATAFGLSSATIKSEGSISNGSTRADWMVLTRNTALLTMLDGIAAQQAAAPVLSKPWTDSHSNIFTLLKH